MNRIDKVSIAAKEFAHQNDHLFVIVIDPETDHLFAGYRDSFTYGKIQTKKGTKARIAKEVLFYSRFRPALDDFSGFKFVADMLLEQLAEFLHLKIQQVPEFFKWLSDALWYLPKGPRRPGEKSGH
ncbi:MAG: hypothetical protein Q8L86_12490 [Vicinamibacterales bacterium]|nr:hypothetical protein [Vicinamibacterales bacterium]